MTVGARPDPRRAGDQVRDAGSAVPPATQGTSARTADADSDTHSTDGVDTTAAPAPEVRPNTQPGSSTPDAEPDAEPDDEPDDEPDAEPDDAPDDQTSTTASEPEPDADQSTAVVADAVEPQPDAESATAVMTDAAPNAEQPTSSVPDPAQDPEPDPGPVTAGPADPARDPEPDPASVAAGPADAARNPEPEPAPGAVDAAPEPEPATARAADPPRDLEATPERDPEPDRTPLAEPYAARYAERPAPLTPPSYDARPAGPRFTPPPYDPTLADTPPPAPRPALPPPPDEPDDPSPAAPAVPSEPADAATGPYTTGSIPIVDIEGGWDAVYRRRHRQTLTFLAGLAAVLIVGFIAWLTFSGVVPWPFGGAVNAAQQVCSRSQPVAPKKIALRVFNGSAREGLASQVSGQLKALGFAVKATGNDPLEARIKTQVQIRHGANGDLEAATMSAYVVGKAEQVQDDRQDTTIDLVLGPSYSRLHTKSELKKSLAAVTATLPLTCPVGVTPSATPSATPSHAPKARVTPRPTASPRR